jgi:outer membrane protein
MTHRNVYSCTFLVFSLLGLLSSWAIAQVHTPIGVNQLVVPENETFATPMVDPEESRFNGVDHTGETNRPQVSWLLRFPKLQESGLQLLVPEGGKEFEERYLRPGHIFSDIELPDISSVELDGNPLTIGSIIRLALVRNMDLQISNMQAEVNAALVWQALSEFDPVFQTEMNLESLARAQNTQEFISTGGDPFDPEFSDEPRRFDEWNQRYSMGFQGKTPYGTTYDFSAGFDIIRNTLTDTSESNLFNPEHVTTVGVQITQPLLQGAGREVNLAPIRVARKNKEISEMEFRETANQVVGQLVKAYYDLVLGYNEIRLRRYEVETLQLLANQRRGQVERGLVSIRQLREILARLAESSDNLLLSEQRFNQTRQAILKLASSEGDPDHNRNFIPVGQMPRNIPEMDEVIFINNAIRYRADYLRFMKELELDEIELDFYENQAKSRLDLVGRTGINGLGNDPNDAMTRALDRSLFDFTVGIVYSRPWNNSRARAKVLEIRKRRMQSVMELKKLQHDAAFEIRQAMDQVEQQGTRLETALELREYFEQEIEDEQILLEKGDRSIYDSLQYYTDLTDAAVREQTIIADLNKAIIDLYLADGSLLRRIGITFLEE